MSTRAWLALMLLVAVFGGIGGWSLRIATVNDRYIRALAEKHEAATRYWDVHTNDILTNNTLERKKRDAKH